MEDREWKMARSILHSPSSILVFSLRAPYHANAMTAAASTDSTKPPEYNRTGIDFRRPMPRPKVDGIVIDFHCHLLAHRHAADWFESARHYGIDCFLTMT